MPPWAMDRMGRMSGWTHRVLLAMIDGDAETLAAVLERMAGHDTEPGRRPYTETTWQFAIREIERTAGVTALLADLAPEELREQAVANALLCVHDDHSGDVLPVVRDGSLVLALAAIAAWSVRDKNLSPTVAPVRLALISRIKEAEAIALGIPEAEQINEVSDDEARAFLESLHGVCTIPKDRSRWHLAELDVICLLKEHLLETPVAATTEDQRRALDAAIKLRLQAALGTHRPRPAAPATPHVPGQRVQPRRKRPKDKR
ncbi:MAG: hypothetical protein AUG49_05115 [Catenulispora sp. 13_1_20CM_3_70_7]|nr:MAG: hypothetical protein AUG49_05115 [Catenulispora sp. 13_1_20CM_3_70_7]